MKKREEKPLGLIGTITHDTIQLPSGKILTGLGGILYQTAVLCGLGEEVILITNLAQGLREQAFELIAAWPGLHREGISLVSGPGNRVYLSYPRRGERQEKLESFVRPLSAVQILPHLGKIDFLLMVFNSGFDLDFITWRQVLASRSCPIWLDVHSLVLSARVGPRHYERFPDWPSWVKGVDYLQANEKEIACLLGHPESRPSPDELVSLAEKSFSLGVKALFITLGQKGVFVASPEEMELLPSFRRRRVVDTTGCGDCFAAATAWRLRQGATPREAASFGLEVASRAAGTSGVAAAYRLASRLARPL